MFFYFGIKHSATVTGSTVVPVRCEHCGEDYYYRYFCTAVGWGQAPYGLGAEGAKRRARERAEELLREKLTQGRDAVPCPRCARYQRGMLRLLRRRRLPGMKTLGLIVLITGLGAAAVAGILYAGARDPVSSISPLLVQTAWAVAALLLSGGVALLLVRGYKNAAYDPNDPETEEERFQLARQFALTKEQAQALAGRK